MMVTIRSPTQITEEARAYLATVSTVTSSELERAIGIGPPFADKLIGKFEDEGLISGPDRHYRRNVRSATGELDDPETRPRRTWEDYALKLVRGIARMRGAE